LSQFFLNVSVTDYTPCGSMQISKAKKSLPQRTQRDAAKFAMQIFRMLFFATFTEYLCALCGKLFALTVT
jgi:hypothetical protein